MSRTDRLVVLGSMLIIIFGVLLGVLILSVPRTEAQGQALQSVVQCGASSCLPTMTPPPTSIYWMTETAWPTATSIDWITETVHAKMTETFRADMTQSAVSAAMTRTADATNVLATYTASYAMELTSWVLTATAAAGH